MVESVGVFSMSGLLHGANLSKVPPTSVLKQASLHCDRLLFLPTGGGPFSFDECLAMILGQLPDLRRGRLESPVRKLFLRVEDVGLSEEEAFAFYSSGHAGSDSSENQEDRLRQGLQQAIGEKSIAGIEAFDTYKEAYAITLDYYLPYLDVSLDFMLSPVVTEAHETVFCKAQATPDAMGMTQVTKGFVNVLIPDWGELRWSDVLAARKSHHVVSFRELVREVQRDHAADPSRGVETRVYERVAQAATSLANATLPNALKTGLVGALANIPLPIGVNPLSVATTGQDVSKARALDREFGWLYMLSELRRSSDKG